MKLTFVNLNSLEVLRTLREIYPVSGWIKTSIDIRSSKEKYQLKISITQNLDFISIVCYEDNYMIDKPLFSYYGSKKGLKSFTMENTNICGVEKFEDIIKLFNFCKTLYKDIFANF